MRPFIVDISSVLSEPGGSIQVARDVEIDPLDQSGVQYEPTSPVSVDVTLMNSGDGVVALGSAKVSMRTACSKCVAPFEMAVSADVETLFIPEERSDTLGDEEEWEPLEGESIDLAPTVLSAIRLALPYAPVHSSECRGICARCGCDLNETDCDCSDEEDDTHPFAVLKDLDLDSE